MSQPIYECTNLENAYLTWKHIQLLNQFLFDKRRIIVFIYPGFKKGLINSFPEGRLVTYKLTEKTRNIYKPLMISTPFWRMKCMWILERTDNTLKLSEKNGLANVGMSLVVTIIIFYIKIFSFVLDLYNQSAKNLFQRSNTLI